MSEAMFEVGDYVKFSEHGRDIFSEYLIDGIYEVIDIRRRTNYPYKLNYNGFSEGYAWVAAREIELVTLKGQLPLPFKFKGGFDV